MPHERLISPEREAALRCLLDDETPVVRAAVALELKRMGDVGLSLLRIWTKDGDASIASAARSIYGDLGGPDPAYEFTRFIRSLNYELESGMLLMNRVIKPDLEPGAVLGQIDAIARRCRELINQPAPPWETCKVINRVLFHEYGFRGNQEDFEDPLNSFLAPLLRRRKGIPISLAVLYIMVARRLGLELEPVSAPGRFLVGLFPGIENGAPLFIDPFERGRFRDVDEVLEMLAENQFPASLEMLTPAPVGEVLCRCCRNLARHYSMRSDPRRARLFADFVREFEAIYRAS